MNEHKEHRMVPPKTDTSSKGTDAIERKDPYFNAGKLKSLDNQYVLYIDVMGMKTTMYRSFERSAIFMGKLHVVLVEVSEQVQGVSVYPVMDGAYVTARQYGQISEFIKILYTRLGRVFVETKNLAECFIVRAGLAYGPIVTGDSIGEEVSPVLNEKADYKKHLLFGFPVVLAAIGEESAPPFGVYLDVTVRTAAGTNLAGIWFKWCSDPLLRSSMGNQMENYYKYAESHSEELKYDEKKIEEHKRKAVQFWGR